MIIPLRPTSDPTYIYSNDTPLPRISFSDPRYAGVQRHLARCPRGEQVIKEQANAAR